MCRPKAGKQHCCRIVSLIGAFTECAANVGLSEDICRALPEERVKYGFIFRLLGGSWVVISRVISHVI